MTIKPEVQELELDIHESWLNRSPWYQIAYFEERVGQELYRSRRYNVETSIIFIRIPAISRRAARSLYTYVSTQLRAIDTAGILGTGDYVICLPHTPRERANVVAGRIRAFLDEYGPQIGVASFGEDGKDFSGLISTAEASIC